MSKKATRKYVRLLLAVFAGVLFLSAQTFAATVKLNKTKATINVGNKVQLELKGANKASWASSNTKVATVKNGSVSGKKAGTAKITAKYKGKTYTCKVTVKNPAKLNLKSVTLVEGGKEKLKVKNVSGTVKWSSRNSKIATVSSSGKVKGVNIGSTKIDAVIYGKTLTCKVKVVSNTSDPVVETENSGSGSGTSGNEYYNLNGYKSALYSGKIDIIPRHLYYSGQYFIAECFVVNGSDSAVSKVNVTDLSFSVDGNVSNFASAAFGVIGDGAKIPAHSYIKYTFRYPLGSSAGFAYLTNGMWWNSTYRF